MSEVIVKGQAEPGIDERIANVLSDSFDPKLNEEAPEEEPQETVNEDNEEEIEVEEDEDVEEEPKKESRAQQRIRELNERTKEAELKAQQLEMQMLSIKPYLEQLQQSQSSVKEPEPILPQEYETQEDFAKAILARAKEEVRKELETEIQPLQHNMRNQQYLGSINQWFASNPEASEVKDTMDKLSQTFDPKARAFYEEQILNGNTFILDSLYSMAKVKAPNNSGVINQARKADQAKASVATGSKSTKSSKTVNSNESYQKALKGDVEDYFKDMFSTMEKI